MVSLQIKIMGFHPTNNVSTNIHSRFSFPLWGNPTVKINPWYQLLCSSGITPLLLPSSSLYRLLLPQSIDDHLIFLLPYINLCISNKIIAPVTEKVAVLKYFLGGSRFQKIYEKWVKFPLDVSQKQITLIDLYPTLR